MKTLKYDQLLEECGFWYFSNCFNMQEPDENLSADENTDD